MARPAPPEDAVIALFEAKHFYGLNLSQLADWTNGREFPNGPPEPWAWDPVSRSTAHTWYRQGLQWYRDHMRLTPDEEYDQLRIGLEWLATEAVRQYQERALEFKDMSRTVLAVAAEVRALTGAGQGAADPGNGEGAEPPERAQLAIVKMLDRQEARGGRERRRVR